MKRRRPRLEPDETPRGLVSVPIYKPRLLGKARNCTQRERPPLCAFIRDGGERSAARSSNITSGTNVGGRPCCCSAKMSVANCSAKMSFHARVTMSQQDQTRLKVLNRTRPSPALTEGTSPTAVWPAMPSGRRWVWRPTTPCAWPSSYLHHHHLQGGLRVEDEMPWPEAPRPIRDIPRRRVGVSGAQRRLNADIGPLMIP